jgi:hypothetical protein
MDVGLAAAAVLYCTDQVLLHVSVPYAYEHRCPYAPDFAWSTINQQRVASRVGGLELGLDHGLELGGGPRVVGWSS